MGIAQLLPFVDQVATDAHLRDFSGQVAAIDGYYWLHKGAKKCACEMVRGTYTTGFVDYCLQQIDLLARNGVEALVVLDGAALPAKSGTETTRRKKRARAEAEAKELLRAGPYDQAQAAYLKAVNITPEHAYQLIQALRRKRVRYVVAPYEADAQIAHLARTGVVQLVLAEDSDMLAFGCPRVLTKLNAQGHGRLLERANLQHARQDERDGGHLLFAPWSEWDAGRFLELCILAGCDYLDSMHGVGIKSAYTLLRRHKTAEKVARVQSMEGKLNASTFEGGLDGYLHYFNKAKQTFNHQRVYDVLQHKVIPLTPPPADAPPMPHCGADIDDALAYRLCELGDLSPDTHEPIVVPGLPPPPPVAAGASSSQPPPSQPPQSQPPSASSSSQPPPSSAPAALASAARTATTGVTTAFASVAGPAAAALRPWGGASGSASSSQPPFAGGKRPVPLKQSTLGSLMGGGGGSSSQAGGLGMFARASSFPAAQPPPPAHAPTPAAEAPVQSLYSKRESKQPFKMPRPASAASGSAPAPRPASQEDSSASSQKRADEPRSAVPPNASAGRHVSGLKRSHFFQSAAPVGGASSQEVANAEATETAETDVQEAKRAALAAAREAEEMACNQAAQEEREAAVDEALQSYVCTFTPSAASMARSRLLAAGSSSTGGKAVKNGSTGGKSKRGSSGRHSGENLPPQRSPGRGGATGSRSSPRLGLQPRAHREGPVQELDLSEFAFSPST